MDSCLLWVRFEVLRRVLKETTEVLTVKCLERKPDGCYEIKKAEEEVEKILVFMRNVPVTCVGPGRYIVQERGNSLN